MLSPQEIKKHAIDFQSEHSTDSDEKSQAQTFWRDFFTIWGLSPQRIGTFEARAKTLKGTVGFIDFFWPGTLLVEHKSRGKDLELALKQALDYCSSGGLKEVELPRFIVVCDFERFVLVELATGDRAEFILEKLHENLHRFNFILGYEQRTYKDEDPVNIKAAELMGKLHDEIKKVGYKGHQLELFLVRLMFCFFADDTGIFQKDQFSDYIEIRTREDGSDVGQAIAEIFRTLNTPGEKRLKNLPEDLAAFPYVNGQLFEEAEDTPYFDYASRTILLRCSHFTWGSVSPAIFGSLFQSVMKDEERRAMGAHYTSEKNILKTIHGLFLDELYEEFTRIQERKIDREKLYKALLARIGSIRLLDPACGCGNFLILSYRELRRLEIKIHLELRKLSGDKGLTLDVGFERGITIDHIYGIEIDEFPSQIARVALWIMDHLMNVELSTALGNYKPSIPLIVSPKIVQGNALRLDWRDIVKPSEVKYILGNPPFGGKTFLTSRQREDMAIVFADAKNSTDLDYVTGWYYKAAQYINSENGNLISIAFVSTNSITQGEQAPVLWTVLMQKYKIKIHFAHRTFRWTNEARGNAAVHVIIIGFSNNEIEKKKIFDYPDINCEPTWKYTKNISPYLIEGKDFTVQKRQKPLCDVPAMRCGSKPSDGGNLVMTEEEKEQYIISEPEGQKYIRKYIGSEEFINGTERFCFWLKEVQPSELKKLPLLMDKINRVAIFRKSSTALPTRKMADYPTLFFYDGQPKSHYLVIPEVSSERRHFIPLGYLLPTIIASNKCYLVPDATRYQFGVLQATMHMAWTRVVSGRLKSDFQYSGTIVYNNFPWPLDPPSEKMAMVEAAAQTVLDARAQFPDSSLADLYDPLSMPPVLVKAHKALDAAVDKCYRKEPFKTELERVEFLFKLYEEYVTKLG
jgi:hypothetical protein